MKLIREPLFKGACGPMVHINGQMFPEFPIEFSLSWLNIVPVWEHQVPPHAHPHDQIFIFLGGDPKNFFDTDFELSFWYGEEGNRDKIVIDTPSLLYIPRGTLHAPMEWKKVDKPILYGMIYLGPVRTLSRGLPSPPVELKRYMPEEIKLLKMGKLP
ncbi:MAG: hypothetical protein QXU81_07550 [Candidatus Bathyarchaeia archaeon]